MKNFRCSRNLCVEEILIWNGGVKFTTPTLPSLDSTVIHSFSLVFQVFLSKEFLGCFDCYCTARVYYDVCWSSDVGQQLVAWASLPLLFTYRWISVIQGSFCWDKMIMLLPEFRLRISTVSFDLNFQWILVCFAISWMLGLSGVLRPLSNLENTAFSLNTNFTMRTATAGLRCYTPEIKLGFSIFESNYYLL